jgi:hypothetical protein
MMLEAVVVASRGGLDFADVLLENDNGGKRGL